ERPGRPFINKRASQILVADSPLGPFKPFANRPHTPEGEMTLDATLFVEDGQPWMVYCHEWVQLGNGLIKAIHLSDDLSATFGEPVTLIDAGDLEWTKKEINYRQQGPVPGVVTDGPWLHRTSDGTLLLFWSSWSKERKYAQTFATSTTGKLAGQWKHRAEPLLQDDRGHGMVFRDFDGRLLLCLHRYFHQPATRVQIWQLEDTGDSVELGNQLLGAP
ncbi:MAG: family 43 glycosylhydrolase, partial [Verrucomicrobiae bacterium]|nr:family 43 glycosylhydrolase [Verrucomicrobiae bacterium]